MMAVIEIRDLTKNFNNFTAVDSVSFDIQEGEFFGLLGPNGAGKTTIINMLSTILKPSAGTAMLNGFTLEDQDNVRKSIGIVFQDPSLDDELTAKENLEFHGRMYHIPRDLRKKRIEEVLRLVDLEDKANMTVRTFSRGMKRRLEIARGLMHRPKILFLDEPTIGLDPQTRRNIWEHIRLVNENDNLTVILTTHNMEEADQCDRIAIIDHGKVIALDTPANLKSVMGGDILTFETPDAERLKVLLKYEWIRETNIFDGRINVTVSDGEKAIPNILDLAGDNNIKIDSVKLTKPTLEDVFIHYTGRTIREEEASPTDAMRLAVKLGWRR
jgi:ABC-2 type transport system ATP-binding protein